ncbi:FAD-binding oxidoreductase [Nonomuraea soli]|uniref:FAD/FMN-containing dehydrogenase n=1 Tax=Nonomuraea soli TaxID=1032476 RepID=A0A7W0HRF0_9ACTN|nr:FAD-binding oxidoreductase [Nonomuraea soli]MBA2892885.1 FAD/FMN-containing dehydrogenase [Nonomuraea soli]
MSVDVIRPGDPSYEQVSGSFAHSGSPAHVFLPRSAAEVAEAVGFARDGGLELSVRSGGHHGAGYATNDGGVIIDLSRLNTIEVDGDRVVIEPGAHWHQVAETLAPYGLALSSGDTRSVGVGGLLVGGGIGWLVRKYGLTIDHVTAVEVVTASGEILRASEAENADLFWAVRGGGGQAGIVVRFELVVPRETLVTFARYTYAADDIASVLKTWRDVMRTADEGLTSTASIFPAFGPDGSPSLSIAAAYAGDDHSGVEVLAGLGELVDKEVKVVPYAEVLEEAGLPPGWQPIVRNRLSPDLSDAAIDTLAAAQVPLMYREVRFIGGALNRVAPEATAFAHRDAEVMISTVLLGAPEDHPARLEAFEELWAGLRPHVKGAYGNFITHPDADDVAEVYPAATAERLAAVKRAHDPGGLFSRNLPITAGAVPRD